MPYTANNVGPDNQPIIRDDIAAQVDAAVNGTGPPIQIGSHTVGPGNSPQEVLDAKRMLSYRADNPAQNWSTSETLKKLAVGGVKAMAGAGLIAGGMIAGPAIAGAVGGGTPTVSSLPLISGAKGAGMALNWANIVPSIISGASGLLGAKEQADAAGDAAGLSQRQFDIARGDALPRINAGNAAVDTLADLMGLYTGTPNPSRFTESPGAQYVKEQAFGAVDRRAAAQGKYQSGQRDQERMRVAAGLGSQEHSQFVNTLLATAGLGTTGANASAVAGNANSAYGGAAMQNRGAARSSGYGAVNDAVQGGYQNFLLEKYLRPQVA